MIVHRGSPRDWPSSNGPQAVSIGVFDGVHRGHQKVLSDLCATAADQDLGVTVLTFDPHPMSIVAPDLAPRLLGTLDQRIEWLGEHGVTQVGVLPFEEVRTMSAAEFVDQVLAGTLGAVVVAVGADFRFGRDRAGDVATLVASGAFKVDIVDLLTAGAAPVSSTKIRQHIVAGDVGQAADDLTRPFTLRADVVLGEQRGRTIGFPTANLRPATDVIIPAHGVYAGRAVVDGARQPAVINVGIRPTFGADRTTVVEVHLLDGEHELYDRSIDVEFVARLREERRFESVEALREQIEADVAAGRAILGA